MKTPLLSDAISIPITIKLSPYPANRSALDIQNYTGVRCQQLSRPRFAGTGVKRTIVLHSSCISCSYTTQGQSVYKEDQHQTSSQLIHHCHEFNQFNISECRHPQRCFYVEFVCILSPPSDFVKCLSLERMESILSKDKHLTKLVTFILPPHC